MVFKFSLKKIYFISFSFIGIIGLNLVFMGVFLLVKHSLVGLLTLLFSPLVLLYSGRFLFFHNIVVYPEYMLLNFGMDIINKKIYYKDIRQFRYAVKEDRISMGQPGVDGKLPNTIALTFHSGEMLFISIEQVQIFCEKLKEQNCSEDKVGIKK